MSNPIRITLELPASHRFLNVLSGCIAELLSRIDLGDEGSAFIYQVQLAAQEVSANIVDHAYEDVADGRFSVDLEVDEDRSLFTARFVDDGVVYSGEPTTAEMQEPGDGGMGLFLIRQLVNQVEYQRLADRNIWTISKQLH